MTIIPCGNDLSRQFTDQSWTFSQASSVVYHSPCPYSSISEVVITIKCSFNDISALILECVFDSVWIAYSKVLFRIYRSLSHEEPLRILGNSGILLTTNEQSIYWVSDSSFESALTPDILLMKVTSWYKGLICVFRDEELEGKGILAYSYWLRVEVTQSLLIVEY